MDDQRIATKSQLKVLLDSNFIDKEKYEELVTAIDNVTGSTEPHSSWHSSDRIIVCFFADGSEKYTQMTTIAIASFLDKTPRIKVGLLTHDEDVRNKVLDRLDKTHHWRILWHKTSDTPHLQNWNPTQYKLDIAKFTENGFECIFWMDSDTLTYGDMTQFLLRFAESNKQFFFVKDHVMHNSDFTTNWTRERPLSLVPQACFMGFKFSIIRQFFSLWRDIWDRWISPFPFSQFPDPNPNFVGSMFCIEQYALAMALAQFLGEHHLGDDAVMLFERELILLQHDGRMSFDVVTKIPAHISGGSVLGISSISGLSLIRRLSGLNLSGLSGVNLSGVNVSGLIASLSGLNLSGITTSQLIERLNLSGLSISGTSISGINLLAFLASGYNLSGLSGLNFSGINISGLSTVEILERLNLSGLNLSGLSTSGLNLSGLTLSELEKLLAGASINLSGVDYKYLQQQQHEGVDDASTPFYSNLTLIDKFGNSFIHYYHQNFEPLKQGAMQGGQFSELFKEQAKRT